MLSKILYSLAVLGMGILVGMLVFDEKPTLAERQLGSTKATIAAIVTPSPEPDSVPGDFTHSAPLGTVPLAAAAVESAESIQAKPVQTAAIDSDLTRLRQLEQELGRLTQRIALVEQAVVLQQQQPMAGILIAEDANEDEEEPPADTPENRQQALIASGVEPDWAADIVWRESQRALERLEIQDLARREGWFGSDRYFEELSTLEDDAEDLHEEIGDTAYDRYLYTMGKSNRVVVDSVIQGSPAEQAGMVPGDVIISYADERLFGWSELREATASGERGETVLIRVMRGEDSVDLLMPRGPLGVRLDTTRMEPIE